MRYGRADHRVHRAVARQRAARVDGRAPRRLRGAAPAGRGGARRPSRTSCAPRWSSAPSTCRSTTSSSICISPRSARPFATAARRCMKNLKLGEADLQALLERLRELLGELDVELSDLAQALLDNDTGRLEQMLRAAAARRRRRRRSSAPTRRDATLQDDERRHGLRLAQCGVRGAARGPRRRRAARGVARRPREAPRAAAPGPARHDPPGRFASSSRSETRRSASATACRTWPRRASTTCPKTRCGA